MKYAIKLERRMMNDIYFSNRAGCCSNFLSICRIPDSPTYWLFDALAIWFRDLLAFGFSDFQIYGSFKMLIFVNFVRKLTFLYVCIHLPPWATFEINIVLTGTKVSWTPGIRRSSKPAVLASPCPGAPWFGTLCRGIVKSRHCESWESWIWNPESPGAKIPGSWNLEPQNSR